MRRLVALAIVLFFAVPFGISLSGCGKSAQATFCNGQNSGVVVGQLTTLDLEPRQTGLSFNQGQIGSISAPSGTDCNAASVVPTNVVYGSTNINMVDIVPTTGRLCAGTWNRNTGNIPDFTTCTPSATQGVAFVTASADGVTSNAIPVFVHPIVTSIQLGAPSVDCDKDFASNCFPLTQPSACLKGPQPATPGAYSGNSCVSQNGTAQLAARTFAGTGATQSNISCSVGPLTFSAQTPGVVTITQNGLATAAAPGSTIINAATSQSSSSAGFFSTCPPKSITLTTVGSTTAPTAPVSIAQNTTQNLVATVLDTNNNPITNLALEYVSTNPTVIPTAGAGITPSYPGAATITAICQPSTITGIDCNPSAFNQIGLFGNGLPVTSNPVQINGTGTGNSTILYVASTQSQYIQPIDFTLNTQPSPIRLPYAPNSMVLSQDLTTLYLGTTNELMVVSVTLTGITLARQDLQVAGFVLAVSPDNSTIVITDPTRNLTYLYTSAGAISTQYGGTGTRAQWSPDSQTVYITTNDGRLLVHSSFTGWTSVPLTNAAGANATDVALTIPSAGVYLANGATLPVTARTNCPTTTVTGTGFTTTTANVFYPQADSSAGMATRLAATNDGTHILGASPTQFLDLTTNAKQGACGTPGATFTSNVASNPLFTGITVVSSTAAGISGYSSSTGQGVVDVLNTSDSAFSFVTYTGTGGVVPQFNPGTLALSNVALQTVTGGTAPLAPVRGVVSADNQTVYLGTTGDNLVHRLTRGTTGFTDTLTPLVPALPNINGGTTSATPDLLAQRPRKSTN